jgi:hypothetical protein
MKIKLDNQIIEQATRCQKHFDCLSNEEHVYCDVEYCVDGKVLFIRCIGEENCEYKVQFGDSCMCTCPVRKEIYNRYRI